jgi:hypothetical protein
VEFGDGRHGRRIPPGATVKATYSRGSGRGRDSVAVTLHRTDTPSTPDQPLWTAVRDRNDGVAVTLHRTDTPPSPDQPLRGVVRNADDEVGVTLHRTDTPPTPDQLLWVVVRDRGDAISFDHYAQDPDVARPPGAGLRRGVWCVVLGGSSLDCSCSVSWGHSTGHAEQDGAGLPGRLRHAHRGRARRGERSTGLGRPRAPDTVDLPSRVASLSHWLRGRLVSEGGRLRQGAESHPGGAAAC